MATLDIETIKAIEQVVQKYSEREKQRLLLAGRLAAERVKGIKVDNQNH